MGTEFRSKRQKSTDFNKIQAVRQVRQIAFGGESKNRSLLKSDGYWKPGGGPTQHRGDQRGGGGAVEKAAREKKCANSAFGGGVGAPAPALWDT